MKRKLLLNFWELNSNKNFQKFDPMNLIYYLTCCLMPENEKVNQPTAYIDLEDEKLNRQSVLYQEDPLACRHTWSVYKKKFEICRKCNSKRDIVIKKE